MKPEETIDFQIKLAWQSIGRLYNTVAEQYGTTWATGNVLLAIDSENGTPVTHLGPKIGLEATSLSRILCALEERDLITRIPDIVDRRRVLVQLTEEGLKRRQEAKQAVISFNNRLRKCLGNREFERCLKHLSKLNDVFGNDEMEGFNALP